MAIEDKVPVVAVRNHLRSSPNSVISASPPQVKIRSPVENPTAGYQQSVLTSSPQRYADWNLEHQLAFFGDAFSCLTALATAAAAGAALYSTWLNHKSLQAAEKLAEENLKISRKSAGAIENAALISIENQVSETIMHCNARYDELYNFRTEVDSEYQRTLLQIELDAESSRKLGAKFNREYAAESKAKIKASEKINSIRVNAYFSRYWGLKSDQFDYWLASKVDPETLVSWLISVQKYLIDGKIGGQSFSEGWLRQLEFHQVVNPTLTAFVETLQAAIERDETQPDQLYALIVAFLMIVEVEKSEMIASLSRGSGHRYTVEIMRGKLSDGMNSLIDAVLASGSARIVRYHLVRKPPGKFD